MLSHCALDVESREEYHKTMRRFAVLFCISIVFFSVSCKGNPPAEIEPAAPPVQEAPPSPPPPPPQGPVKQPEQAPVFDPSSISQEEKDTAMQEIQQLTQRLNSIIKAKNYNTWVTYLDPSHLATINSREFLEGVSKSPAMVKQNIVLNSAHDYFINVVVPSRANSRVDDIEFISQNRVKAYTFDSKGNKLRLYDLEKTGTVWKIIN